MREPSLWIPDLGLPDGRRARDYLRDERCRQRERYRHIRDPKVERTLELAIARVNTSQKFAAGGDTTIASDATSLTAGNLIVVLWRADNGEVNAAPTDTATNTYRRVGVVNFSSTTMAMWYATNVSGHGSNVVTVTFGGSRSNRGLLTAQYSGFTSAVQLQTHAGPLFGQSGGTITSDAFNTQTADALLIQGVQINATGTTWTPGSYTSAVEDASTVQILAELIVSSVQTLATAAMTNSSGGTSVMQIVAAFAEPASGGSSGGGPLLSGRLVG